MRDLWYGDKRDIVKWGAILVLARKRSIRTVLQVALYRPDQPNYQLTINGGTEPLPIDVFRHFRDIDQIQRLAENVKLKIEVHKDIFRWNSNFRTKAAFRKAYFDKVAKRIKEYSASVIVFLDPDTGIAPRLTPKYEHVSPHEIHTVFQAIRRGDVLVSYQHARRGDGGWLNSIRSEFSQAVGPNIPVDIIACQEIANDVAFFAVER